MPDLPTIAESGLPGYETYTWNALFAPAGTPPEVIAQLNEAAVKALADPDVQAKLPSFGATVVGSTPERAGRARHRPSWRSGRRWSRPRARRSTDWHRRRHRPLELQRGPSGPRRLKNPVMAD